MIDKDARSIEAFLEMMVSERGAAANTVGAYNRDIRGFSAYLNQSGCSLTKATPQQVRNYLAKLVYSGRGPSTQARHLSTLRQFFRFLQSEEQRTDHPCATISLPRRGRTLPKVLNENEVDRLITEARNLPGAEGLRLLTVVELLYATGLRISELISLPLHALAPNSLSLIVKGKGGRERMVPVGEPAGQALPRGRYPQPPSALFRGQPGLLRHRPDRRSQRARLGPGRLVLRRKHDGRHGDH